MRRLTYIAILSLVFSLSASLASAAPSPQSLRIGAILDLSHEYAMAGGAFRDGIDLAVDEVNRSGGVKGQPLQIVYEDSRYDMKNVAAASQKLLTIDKVVAGVVATYTEAMVAGPAFERAKTPLITLWDSAPQIEEIGEYTFGIGVWSPSASSKASDFALRELKAKTAVTISTNGEWSLGVAQGFREQFEKGGGKILSHFEMNPADTDFRSVLTRVKALNPQVLYVPISDNVAAFWMQMRRIGFQPPVVTSDVLTQEILDNIGDSAEGTYQTQVADPSDDATQKMMGLFREKYGKDCKQVFFTGLGYDSIQLLVQAMNVQGVDTESIKQGLYATRGFKGSAGETSINNEGSARKLVGMFQVRQRRLELVSGSN